MFSQYEATYTSSDFFSFNYYELVNFVRSIPGLEFAKLNREHISCLSSPRGLAMEISLSDRSDYLLCLYDIRELEQARRAWNFALYSSALQNKICKGTYRSDSALQAASFSNIGKYSYVLMPLTKGSSLKEKRHQENFLQIFMDFVLLSFIPVSLKSELRLSFVDAVRDKEKFFREFKKQLKRAEEHFFSHRELKAMPLFLKECGQNLLASTYFKNTMQLSQYSLSGIQRLKDGSLHMSKALCLEYSIMDINLCDLLCIFEDEKDTIKSLLIHVYYNLQVPLQFFNLNVLYTFIRILQNWKLPYSDQEFEDTVRNLLKFKSEYRALKTCVPRWYQEPAVLPRLGNAAFKSNVTFLYLSEHIKGTML